MSKKRRVRVEQRCWCVRMTPRKKKKVTPLTFDRTLYYKTYAYSSTELFLFVVSRFTLPCLIEGRSFVRTSLFQKGLRSQKPTWYVCMHAIQLYYLAHELRDDPVEGGTLVAKTLLPRAERSKVLCGLGHDIRAQLHHDSPCRRSSDLDVEKHLWGRTATYRPCRTGQPIRNAVSQWWKHKSQGVGSPSFN